MGSYPFQHLMSCLISGSKACKHISSGDNRQEVRMEEQVDSNVPALKEMIWTKSKEEKERKKKKVKAS